MHSLSKITAQVVCGLILLISVAPSEARSAEIAPRVDLSPRLDTDQTHRFEYTVKSTQTMSAFGQDQTSQAEMAASIELVRLPSERADGNAVFGLRYEWLRVAIDGGQVPGAFDSRDPGSSDEGNVYAEICRPIVDQQIRLIVDTNGTIRSVEGLDALAPDGLAGVLFEQLFGEQAAKAMFQPLLRVLDNGPATRAVGDRWTVDRPAVSSLGIPKTSAELRVETAIRFLNESEGILRESFGGS